MTLAFVCIQLDTGLEIFQLISGQQVYHYFGSDGGGGFKYWDFYGDILFELPLCYLNIDDIMH